jgi:hypothetical protein
MNCGGASRGGAFARQRGHAGLERVRRVIAHLDSTRRQRYYDSVNSRPAAGIFASGGQPRRALGADAKIGSEHAPVDRKEHEQVLRTPWRPFRGTLHTGVERRTVAVCEGGPISNSPSTAGSSRRVICARRCEHLSSGSRARLPATWPRWQGEWVPRRGRWIETLPKGAAATGRERRRGARPGLSTHCAVWRESSAGALPTRGLVRVICHRSGRARSH